MAHPATKPSLRFDMEVELFAAMKTILFKKYLCRDLAQMLQFYGRKVFPRTKLALEPFVEPNCPEWFDDYQADPVKIILPGFQFESMSWMRDLRKSFSDKPSLRKPPELYCETNTSTHVVLRFQLTTTKKNPSGNHGSAEGKIIPFDDHLIKKLALLLVAFESEIDKVLPDHAGYVTHSASALSNSSNPLLEPLATPNAKLQHIWTKCHSTSDIIQTLCPPIPTDKYPTHLQWHQSAYKYNFLPPQSPSQPPAIEFRQHPSTLSPTELTHWTLLTGNLILVASHLSDEDLLDLVHYHDSTEAGPVRITELFLMMTTYQRLTRELAAMMQYYSRKSIARGPSLRAGGELRVRLGKREAGARRLEWKIGKEGKWSPRTRKRTRSGLEQYTRTIIENAGPGSSNDNNDNHHPLQTPTQPKGTKPTPPPHHPQQTPTQQPKVKKPKTPAHPHPHPPAKTPLKKPQPKKGNKTSEAERRLRIEEALEKLYEKEMNELQDDENQPGNGVVNKTNQTDDSILLLPPPADPPADPPVDPSHPLEGKEDAGNQNGNMNGDHTANGTGNGDHTANGNANENGDHTANGIGNPNGDLNGIPNGIPNGDPNGDPNGIQNGDHTAIPNGVPNGVPNGNPNGIPNGIPNGNPNRDLNGNPNGIPNGILNGNHTLNGNGNGIHTANENGSHTPNHTANGDQNGNRNEEEKEKEQERQRWNIEEQLLQAAIQASLKET